MWKPPVNAQKSVMNWWTNGKPTDWQMDEPTNSGLWSCVHATKNFVRPNKHRSSNPIWVPFESLKNQSLNDQQMKKRNPVKPEKEHILQILAPLSTNKGGYCRLEKSHKPGISLLFQVPFFSTLISGNSNWQEFPQLHAARLPLLQASSVKSAFFIFWSFFIIFTNVLGHVGKPAAS